MHTLPEFRAAHCLSRTGIILFEVLVLSRSGGSPGSVLRARAADLYQALETYSPHGLKRRARLWAEYSRAKDDMLRTRTLPYAPWRDGSAGPLKRHARWNCISNLAGAFDLAASAGPVPRPARANAPHDDNRYGEAPTSLILSLCMGL